MKSLWSRAAVRQTAAVLVLSSICLPVFGKQKPEGGRWAEGTAGCTFSADPDGKFRWGIWSDNAGVVLAIDSQELQFSRRRLQHTVAVLVTIRDRGAGKFDLDPHDMTLEFVDHHHTVARAMDPDDYVASLQLGAVALQDETARQASKHPDKQKEREAALQQYQREVAELQDFVQSRSLRSTTLYGNGQQVTGWVYFPTRAKWVGQLKNTEQFVFRVPVGGRVMEFPITMPPNDQPTLRRR